MSWRDPVDVPCRREQRAYITAVENWHRLHNQQRRGATIMPSVFEVARRALRARGDRFARCGENAAQGEAYAHR